LAFFGLSFFRFLFEAEAETEAEPEAEVETETKEEAFLSDISFFSRLTSSM
jgi:hypothetical protein